MSPGQIAACPSSRPRGRRAAAKPALDLKAPALRRGFVSRPALARQLIDAHEASLAVLVAPPGYGKSALLAEWAECDPRPFLWLGLSENSSHAKALTSQAALAALVREAARCHPSFVVVLDDAHLIDRDLLRDLVGAALPVIGRGSTIAVASRTEPPLPLGRLRAHRRLVELRTQQLGMNSAEAAALLKECGVTPDFADVQALVAHTEGWPAALYLAALTLRERETAAEFSGANHLVAEYLRDEVLEALPDDLRVFARDTSVLQELSGPLCDSVLGRPATAVDLRRLAEASPLLSPTDAAHHRYRWHALVREALRDELQVTAPERETDLLKRTSRWYARREDVQRAIDYAVEAGDVSLAGRLLWQNILNLVTSGRRGVVLGWLEHVAPNEIDASAPLALAAAITAALSGRLDAARHWSAAASSRLASGPNTDQLDSLRVGIAVVQAIDAHDGVERMAEAAAQAAKREPATSPWRPLCQLLAGVGLHLRGDREDAELLLERAARLSGNAMPALTCLSLAQRAMIAIDAENWELAAELTDQGAVMLEDSGLEDDPLSALTYAAAAASRAHGGRIDEAKHDLRRGVDLLAMMDDGVSWYGAETRILLAHASLWLADVVGARSLLAEASRLARRTADAAIFADWFDRAWAHMDTLAETSLAGPSSLTIAELRILRFLPSHRSFREIAEHLGVSGNTVKTQAHAIYRKLGAASRSEAVAHALRAGLLGQ